MHLISSIINCIKKNKKINFESWQSYGRFKDNVKNKSRFILDEESKKFLKAIESTCINRIKTIPKSASLWRAQIGSNNMPFYQGSILVDELPVPFDNERMIPLINSASEGRVNSKGIPCLYVASDKETAMSEVRPNLDSILSVGEFNPTRELKVIDFTKHQGKMSLFLKEPNEKQKTEAVWTDIDNAFSTPITNTDFNSDYVPTQIISEFIKTLGYDGIVYKSSFRKEGYNIALFDLNIATISKCNIFKVTDINFSFKSIENQFNQY